MANQMNGTLKLVSIVLTILIVFAGIVAGYTTLKNDMTHMKEDAVEQEKLNKAMSETILNTEKLVIELRVEVGYMKKILDRLDNQ